MTIKRLDLPCNAFHMGFDPSLFYFSLGFRLRVGDFMTCDLAKQVIGRFCARLNAAQLSGRPQFTTHPSVRVNLDQSLPSFPDISQNNRIRRPKPQSPKPSKTGRLALPRTRSAALAVQLRG